MLFFLLTLFLLHQAGIIHLEFLSSFLQGDANNSANEGFASGVRLSEEYHC